MDPLTGLIITALVLGAAKGVGPTAEQAVKDAYAGLKRVIIDKYQQHRGLANAVEGLESEPDSTAWQDMAAQKIEEAKANEDVELLRLARALHEKLKQLDPAAYDRYGFSLKEVEAVNATIEDIVTKGQVAMEKLKLSGDLTIRQVRAGASDKDTSPNP